MPSVLLEVEVRDYLLANAALAALVGDRVYIAELPRRIGRASRSRIAPSIMIEGVPAGFKPDAQRDTVGQVDIHCFAGDLAAVRALHALIYERLDTIVEPAGALVWARPSGASAPSEDPETGARGTYRSYLCGYVDYVP